MGRGHDGTGGVIPSFDKIKMRESVIRAFSIVHYVLILFYSPLVQCLLVSACIGIVLR